MTILNAYEFILVELNKVQAPALLLDDFITLFNKGVQEYENERYNLYESKQQLTDDLRILTKSERLTVKLEDGINHYGTSYKCELPSDYVHILNCACQFTDKNPRCNSSVIHQAANKLNTNQRSQIINNFYLKPSVKNPYYYIINIDDPSLDTNVDTSESIKKTQLGSVSKRYGNSYKPVMQILCGDNARYTLDYVYIDYLRAPIYYHLTQEELDAVNDTTQVIEFPDYVIYEIINRIVSLIMENGSNPRIQTHPAVNKSII